MSVVNKMLQDLEARQAQHDETTADYQPPQKKQSKLMVVILLFLAVAAIIFALSDKIQLFDASKNTQDAVTTMTQSVPAAAPKKMAFISKQTQPEPQTAVLPSSKSPPELFDTEAEVTSTSQLLVTPKIPLLQNTVTTSRQSSVQKVENQDKPFEAETSAVPSSEAAPQQKSSFSMTGSSQESNRNSLKQGIAESLLNDDLELARSLLQQLLAVEPNNIKARKKLASLLFADGDYVQSKQVLTQGIELHPAQSDLRLMLARLHVVQKEPSKAMAILAEFQPSVDQQSEYLAYRAALAQQLKQTDLAKSDYQTLTNIESTNAKWWLGLAIARDQLGETNMALQAYNKANSLDQLRGSVNDFMQQRISVLAGTQ